MSATDFNTNEYSGAFKKYMYTDLERYNEYHRD
jgi:hypothetical protein